jgi:molecular chaperone GrpE
MSDDDRRAGLDTPREMDRIELDDSGQTLEDVLAEEERSAIAAAEEKLQSVMHDLEDLKDRHARKLAEFENMRKRTEREKGEYFRNALANFLRDLLPIVDSFDSAVAHAPADALATDFGQGVVLIRRQLADLLKKYGLTEADTSGPFDPNLHEAVATEESEELSKDTILEVLRKGYVLHDRLLRPAWVKVAVRPVESARLRDES